VTPQKFLVLLTRLGPRVSESVKFYTSLIRETILGDRTTDILETSSTMWVWPQEKLCYADFLKMAL